MSSGTFKVQPPDLRDVKSYDVYKSELRVWELITPVPEDKRGAVIAASLPNDCDLKRDLRSLVFEEIRSDELCSSRGLEKVIQVLDRELGKSEIDALVQHWDEFEEIKRGDQNVEDFISSFDRAYRKVESDGSKIPSTQKAFMMLKRANVSKVQRMLVLSKMNLDDRDKLYENMCKELKVVMKNSPTPKEENDLPDEDVLTAAGYVYDPAKARRGRGSYSNRGGGGRGAGGYSGWGGTDRGRNNGTARGGKHSKKTADQFGYTKDEGESGNPSKKKKEC